VRIIAEARLTVLKAFISRGSAWWRVSLLYCPMWREARRTWKTDHPILLTDTHDLFFAA
jgi:hypothetical protein